MNTNLPFSQADLEAMRTGSAHAVAEMGWAWMMTVDAREPHGGTKEDFQSALVKAGLLQDNSNIQPPAIYGTPLKLYSYDELFSPKETKNGKTENDRGQINSVESHGQIRDSAALDCDPARDQSDQCDAAQNQKRPSPAESKFCTGDLRGNPESDRECEIRKTTEIRISVSEAYWVLGMLKKLERIGLEINGASKPLLLRPEIRDFRKRIRQELRDIEDRVRMGNK